MCLKYSPNKPVIRSLPYTMVLTKRLKNISVYKMVLSSEEATLQLRLQNDRDSNHSIVRSFIWHKQKFEIEVWLKEQSKILDFRTE